MELENNAVSINDENWVEENTQNLDKNDLNAAIATRPATISAIQEFFGFPLTFENAKNVFDSRFQFENKEKELFLNLFIDGFIALWYKDVRLELDSNNEETAFHLSLEETKDLAGSVENLKQLLNLIKDNYQDVCFPKGELVAQLIADNEAAKAAYRLY